MDTEVRFLLAPSGLYPRADGLWDVCLPVQDGDSRRWLRLHIVGVDDATFQSWNSENYISAWAPVRSALAAVLNSRQIAGVTSVMMTADGDILSLSEDPSLDVTPGTYYASPEDYQLPNHWVADTIPRNRLVELGRLASYADLVAPTWPSSDERLVFKHYEDEKVMTDVWYSIQILAALSGHGHVVPMRHLVVHEHSGGVVGFTMPFIPGGSLDATRTSRTFKLKWAKQLFQVLDDLNLEYGIDHRDVRPRNIMVDPETDNLVLIDLGKARKRGTVAMTCVPTTAHTSMPLAPMDFYAEYFPEREAEEEKAYDMSTDPDVNAAIVTLHDLVTRSPTDQTWHTTEWGLWNGVGINAITAGPWTAHPEARLDSPAEDYRAALTDWLRRRRADPRCLEPAAPLAFSEYMPIPRGDAVNVADYRDPMSPHSFVRPSGTVTSVPVSGYNFLRRDAGGAGRAVVEWERPLGVALDGARKLLATGRYADEEEEEEEGGEEGEWVEGRSRLEGP